MKNNLFKLIIIFILLIILGSVLFFNLNNKEYFSKTEQWSIKNATIDLYCPVPFKNGTALIEDLSAFCEDENLPSDKLKAKITQVGMTDNAVLGIVKSQIEEMPVQFKLVAANEKNGYLANLELDTYPDKISINEDIIEINVEGKIERYRLICNHFEPFVKEEKKFADPEYGFLIAIPKNWEKERVGNIIHFFHPASGHVHRIYLDLRDFSLQASENNPYDWEFDLIKESLEVFDLCYLPDYRKMKKGLENYLEINTVEDIIKFYDNNQVFSFDILAAGNPHGWEGTPGGLYHILSKEGLRFSTESDVYMPFSVRIYGKYLLHGEAYYPSGIPYTSDISGGCVRVRNQEMKDLYGLLEKGLPILSITHQNEEFPIENTVLTEFPTIVARSFLVVDMDSGKVFASKNSNEVWPIGSITQMMTAIVATEQMGITTSLTVKDYMIEEDNSEFRDGQEVRMIDLLVPVLAGSSNDATRVLTYYLGRDNTLNYMQNKAKSIGMGKTTFVETTGVDRDNLSTAKDLYYLSYYLLNTRIPLLNISRGAWAPQINYQAFPDVRNRNIFYADSSFIGGKTGHHPAIGYSGFFIFDVGLAGQERKISFIVLGAPSTEQLSTNVLNLKEWLINSYHN